MTSNSVLEPQLRDAIMDMDGHRLDPWTRWLVETHGLRHPDTRAMLVLLLHMANYDNVTVEKKTVLDSESAVGQIERNPPNVGP